MDFELKLEIASYCRITDKSVILNGKALSISRSSEESNLWLDDIYKSINMQYPKFFKMDRLCKAGVLAAELVLGEMGKIGETGEIVFPASPISPVSPISPISIVCFNSSSSLDDDTVYQNTINDKENYYPSPSVFVYTLANIVTGEIAIRHKIAGETSFYISEKFDAAQIYDTITDMFRDNSLNGLLCGWVEYCDNHCDVLVMYVKRGNGNLENVSEEMILDLYNKC